MKNKVISVLFYMLMFYSIGNASRAKADNKIDLIYDNIVRVDVIYEEAWNYDASYNYVTSERNELTYIAHYLNSLNLKDDGINKRVDDADSCYIKIYMSDNEMISCEFYNGNMFYDSNWHQYGIERQECSRTLELFYALKTKQLILPDNVTFETSAWAEANVNKAIEIGLVPKLNQINYIGDITRLEVCQLADNLLKNRGYGDNVIEKTPFLDTNDISVASLYQLGIISGKSETSFCPYDFITREEFAKILFNLYHYVDDSDVLVNDNVYYKDQDEISNWAADSVSYTSSLGLLKGNENGEFEPLRNITKEEVIVTLLRLNDYLFEVQ